MIGKTFGTFRVLKQIGRGGMGVVYEAEDISLGRHVALKFLPETLASDPQALERFKREARSASALNHPNICTIHAVGEQDGNHYMAMELLEGETLDRRLQALARPLPINDLLDYAIEVADALENAHSKGFIHRDIKPSNIFLTKQNHAKVLDFGLAKLAGEAHVVAAPGDNTATNLTSPGMAVGTVSYMSPEQARGEDLDARSDIFSFGAVLYEMATGVLPFQGTTSAVIFEAILNRMPVPVVRLNPGAPEGLERIIEKALDKDRDLRYQNAAELRTDLKRLKRDSDSGRTGAVSVATPAATAAVSAAVGEAQHSSSTATEIIAAEAKRHKLGIGITALILAGLVAAAAFGIYSLVRKERVPFQKAGVRKLTDSGNADLAAISPDGKYVLYSQRDTKGTSLWLRHMATNSIVQVIPPSPQQIIGISFTPDSNYFYYVRTDEQRSGIRNLYKAAVLGGAAQKLVEDIDSAVTFSPDGKQIAFRRDSPSIGERYLIVADADGGNARKLVTKGPGSFIEGNPAWSPNGKQIALGGFDFKQNNYGAISFFDAVSGQETFLPQRLWDFGALAWPPDGRGIFGVVSDRSTRYERQVTYMEIPSGKIHNISNDLNSYIPPALAASADGKTLVAVAETVRNQIQLVDLAKPDAAPKTVTTGNERLQVIDWSRDNKILTSNASGDLVLREVDGTNARTLFQSNTWARAVRECGPDRLVFMRNNEENDTRVWQISRDGGNLRELTHGDDDSNPSCSADGKWLYFADRNKGQIMRMLIDGGKPELLVDIRTDRFVISPDDKLLAAAYSRGTNVSEFKRLIGFYSMPDGKLLFEHESPFTAVSSGRFAADNKLLYFAGAIGGNVTNIFTFPVGKGGEVRQLTHFDQGHIFHFVLSPDGKQAAMIRGTREFDAVMFTDETQ